MTKKDKNKIIIWIIVGIVIILFIYHNTNIISPQIKQTIQESINKLTSEGGNESITQGPGGIQYEDFMSVQLYDLNDNIITNNEFAIVNGVSGVEYIGITIRIRNTGDVPLNCIIKNATPYMFYDSFDSYYINAAVGGVYTLRTRHMSVSLFEGPVIPFSVIVGCSSSKQLLPDKTRTILLNITNSESPGYEVEIIPLETEAKVYKIINPLEGAASSAYNNMTLGADTTKSFEIQFGVTRNYCPTPEIICLYPSYINNLTFSSFNNGRSGSYDVVAQDWVEGYISVNPQFDSSSYTGFFIKGIGFRYPETITISDALITLPATLTTGSSLPPDYQKGGVACGISCNNIISAPFSKLYFNNANGV